MNEKWDYRSNAETTADHEHDRLHNTGAMVCLSMAALVQLHQMPTPKNLSPSLLCINKAKERLLAH